MKVFSNYLLPFVLLILVDIVLSLVVGLNIFNLCLPEKLFWGGFIFGIMLAIGCWGLITLFIDKSDTNKT